MIRFMRAKLHGIRVTDANLNYQGSITLDPEQLELAGMLPLEFVDIWNLNSGAHISTYVIAGTRGARQCVLNGAAARTCQVGDPIVVAASFWGRPEEFLTLRPKVVLFEDSGNRVREVQELTP